MKQIEPLVSVIMIFFNAASFMREAIESVFAQTDHRWELLLVDDGSTDESTAIALAYARQHPNKVRYLEHAEHQNRGMSATRNLGIQAARGAYIALLDADDVYLPQKLEKQIAILDAHPQADMTYSATLHWYSWTGRAGDQTRDRTRKLGVAPDTLVQPPTLMAQFLRQTAQTPATCGVLIRRDAIKRAGGFEEQFRGMFEDQVFFAKVCLHAPVFVGDGVWDYYRQHPQSHAERARQSGHDQKRQRTPLYYAFLCWLETYLVEQNIHDRSVWKALRQELLPYRHPVRYQFSAAANMRRIKWATGKLWHYGGVMRRALSGKLAASAQ